MTDPSYYKDSTHKSPLWHWGYRNAKEIALQGDFEGEKWKHVLQYFRDLTRCILQVRNPAVFRIEHYNELPEAGSIIDELAGDRFRWIDDAVDKTSVIKNGKVMHFNPRFQLNLPTGRCPATIGTIPALPSG